MATILIVDDIKEISVLTKLILEKEGYEVTVVSNSKDCFEKINEKKPDLILLDVMIREKNPDGWDICKKIKEDPNTSDINVAMFTVLASEADKKKSETCGADAHINKPFRNKDLLKTIEGLLKGTLS